MAAKKPATTKPAPKKSAAKKPAADNKATTTAKKIKAIPERYNKTQVLTQIAANTQLSKQQVSSVLDELADLIEGHLKKSGCGEFVLPGLLKVTTVKKPAKKARKGVHPITGEEMMFKAKPASIAVKVRPLKKLKEMAG